MLSDRLCRVITSNREGLKEIVLKADFIDDRLAGKDLVEDGSPGAGVNNLLLESGDNLLLEDSISVLLLE